MTPRNPLYFDRNYSSNSVEKVYAFDPVPPGATPGQAEHILGAQGSIWTESGFLPGRRRRSHLSARVRTGRGRLVLAVERMFDDFQQPLDVDLKRLDALDSITTTRSDRSFDSWRSAEVLKTPTSAVEGHGMDGWQRDESRALSISGGANSLEIDEAEVLANGAVIASDPHHGVAGMVSKDNVLFSRCLLSRRALKSPFAPR